MSGQDGSYLAELLLEKGYEVHGIVRRASTFNTERIDHLARDLHIHHGDLSDSGNIARLIGKIAPDEVYHLGAQSHVRVSFDIPEYTANITGLGTLRLLEIIRDLGLKTKFYQASSSEMFGNVAEIPQTEKTPFSPRSPYGCSKVFSYWITKNYREGYGMFAVNGILFNHESPRRGKTFVTRKITRGLSRIVLGLDEKLYLGNLNAKRDWGYAKDYVDGMWRMLQQKVPDDYILATGETHSVREFAEEAAKCLGIHLVWKGKRINEKGLDRKTGKVIIEVNPRFFRPAEIDVLIGDPSKARKKLGWVAKTKFADLVQMMTEADFKAEKYAAHL